MFKAISQAITEVVQFTNKHRIDAEFHVHTVGQLQGHTGVPDEYWERFEKRAGVYVFFDRQKDSVHYVGMSKWDTGTRLFGWLFKPNKVSEALHSEDLVLSVVLENEPYMSPALESFLIDRLKPSLNNVR